MISIVDKTTLGKWKQKMFSDDIFLEVTEEGGFVRMCRKMMSINFRRNGMSC